MSDPIVTKLKTIYQEKGITRCELCDTDNFLSFAHRHKRRWYYGQEEKLTELNQTVLACVPCHDKYLEFNKDKEDYFVKLRGEE